MPLLVRKGFLARFDSMEEAAMYVKTEHNASGRAANAFGKGDATKRKTWVCSCARPDWQENTKHSIRWHGDNCAEQVAQKLKAVECSYVFEVRKMTLKQVKLLSWHPTPLAMALNGVDGIKGTGTDLEERRAALLDSKGRKVTELYHAAQKKIVAEQLPAGSDVSDEVFVVTLVGG